MRVLDERPSWRYDGRDWPNRDASRFVEAAGFRWHVQEAGSGPDLLLIHGTGAATHSWRDLLPLLAREFRVVAPDLPGHGFTAAPARNRLALSGMAADLSALLSVLELQPAVAIGHSAGAAILARMCLDGTIAPRLLVSLNGALLPFRGVAGRLFSPLARLLASTSVFPTLFATRASNRAVVERLLRGTGSAVDAEGVEYYWRLVQSAGHCAAALDMMANWDLEPLLRTLPKLQPQLDLVFGERDRTVDPVVSRRVSARVPGARLVPLPGLGHLAHEEAPERVADLIIGRARELGVLGSV